MTPLEAAISVALEVMQGEEMGFITNQMRTKELHRVLLRIRIYEDARMGYLDSMAVYADHFQAIHACNRKDALTQVTSAMNWARSRFPDLPRVEKRVLKDFVRERAWELFEADAVLTGMLRTNREYCQDLLGAFPAESTRTGLDNIVRVHRRKFLQEYPGVSTMWGVKEDARLASLDS